MDAILVFDAAGNLLPANMVGNHGLHVAPPAGLVGNHGVEVAPPAGLVANGPAVFHPALLNGPDLDDAYEDDDGADDDEAVEEWKVVRSRKHGMPRGAHRLLEEPPVQEAIPCVLEFEWEPKPKSAPLRAVKKWANVRKGGYVGTKEGMAIIVYPCYDPESN